MDNTRRRFLQRGAVGAAVSVSPWVLPGNLAADSIVVSDYTNRPDNDRVVFGFTVPQSGPFESEGADELRAFELAVDHLNGAGDGGMLRTMQPRSLQGNGVLGRTVDYVVADTETKPDVAREAAGRLIDNEGAVMIAGGSSSGVAIALQGVCQEKGVVFMAGLTHSNDTTGVDGVKNGFRHFLNAYMSNNALAAYLTRQYTGARKVYYLTADYNWGYSNETAFIEAFEPKGWETVASVKTPLAQTDFTDFLTPVIESGADTLIMSLYGANMVNALTGVTQLGLRDLQPNGNDFVMAIPLHTEIMALGAGANVEGIYGTMNWHWSLTDAASSAFTSSFRAKYGKPPSSAAHTCYVQTLLYADACERAGTFDPCAVIGELQGHRFDGMGNGVTEYRASDHQCFKDVLIGKGKSDPASTDDLIEVVDTIAASEVTYATDNDQFNSNLGSCFNGEISAVVNGTSSNSLGGSGSSTSSDSSGGVTGLAGLAALSAIFAARKLISRKTDEKSRSDSEL